MNLKDNMNEVATVEKPQLQVVERKNKNGKLLGTRVSFGKGSFKAWREHLKGVGMNATEAKAAINKSLAEGDGNLRWAQFQVATEAARAKGLVPTEMDFTKKQNAATARFAAVPKAGPSVDPVEYAEFKKWKANQTK